MPEAKRPLKVFLSYASQDRPLVRELSRRLVGEGWIDTWVDEKSLLPGQDWRVKIEEAVEEADVVIICLSNHSVSKEGHVQKELRYAREIALEKPDETIFLIPLRLDECEVPRGLRFYQWVDYFGDAKNNSYDALVKSLRLRYEQKLRLEEIEHSREEQARLEAEELARRKAEKEKVEREVGEKAAREKAEQRAYQLALLRKNVRRPFAFLKSNIAISPSKLRIAGFVGIVIAVLGLGFWGARQPKWPFPTKSPSATITLPATDATVVATKVSMEVKDSSGSTMIFIPEGKFIMGIDNSFSDEKPAHSVELASFYMDKNEVTNSQYKTCVAAGVCKRPFYTNLYYKLERDNHPVVTVDWDMALTFCKWRGGSLPTEAQWEKAARGEEE